MGEVLHKRFLGGNVCEVSLHYHDIRDLRLDRQKIDTKEEAAVAGPLTYHLAPPARTAAEVYRDACVLAVEEVKAVIYVDQFVRAARDVAVLARLGYKRIL